MIRMSRETGRSGEENASSPPEREEILTFQELGLTYHVTIDAIRGWVRHGHLTESEGLFYVAGSARVYHSISKKKFLNVKGRRRPKSRRGDS